MRIFKALNLIPKRINLICPILGDFPYRRRFIHLSAVFKYFYLQLFSKKVGYDLALPGICRVKNLIGLTVVDFFVIKRYNIGNGLATEF